MQEKILQITPRFLGKSGSDRWAWANLSIIDEYMGILGPSMAGVYLVYARRSIGKKQSTKLPLEPLADYLGVGRKWLSNVLVVFEIFGLMKIKREHCKPSTTWLLRPEPLTPERIVQLRMDIQKRCPPKLKSQILKRLDSYQSLPDTLNEYLKNKGLQSEPEFDLKPCNDHQSSTKPKDLELQQLWNEVKQALEDRMIQSAYVSVIHGTKLLERDDSRFRIGVPTENALAWLNDRYINMIREVVTNVIGEPAIVEFSLMRRQI